MKRCLIVLITFCCLSSRIFGQSSSVAIDSLIKFRIITPKERPVLDSDLARKGGASYRVRILEGLEEIILQKTFHIDMRKGSYSFSYKIDNYNKKSQDSVNTSLRGLLEKLKRADLLTNRVYNYTVKAIDSNQYIAEVQMVSYLTEMSSRLEWLAPDKLLPVAEQLHKYGIVSDSSFVRLGADINDGKIESAFQLNNYCNHDRIFDVSNYIEDKSIRLEQLHRDIATMLPGLNFTNFSYTTSPDPDSAKIGLPEIKFKVSLVCNGQTYKYASTILELKNKEGKLHLTDIDLQTFHRVFNKILTDEHSPLRLHAVMFSSSRGSSGDGQRFSLIALTGEQARVFMKDPCMSYMFASMESYDNTLTSGRRDSTIMAWKNIGLFSHLSANELTNAIDDAEAADLFSMDDLLRYFPRVTYSMDSALTSQDRTYTSLLHHLAKITHGAFNPTGITQKKVKGGVRLQYQSNGKIHSFIFKTDYGWFDTKFPAFVKHLGLENDLPGDFYNLPYVDAVVYLTKQQYASAVQFKLLDFDMKRPGHVKRAH
ncbi:hypothetical protein [uncultured Mucilaginibacter sp.]|uniref:hypothetical protein n=1 Tax=uncultured Mucilaginibacter sp. TaxID=797541 RepID=UPI0025DEF42B|nr:hypothetical protein [uncultured Mucilaginibacter sp.]